MANIKISQLPAATVPLTGNEVAPVVQNGVTVKAAIADFSDFVNPAAFGAVGNGVADDTTALRAAFAYAAPLNRAVMLEGTYLISDYIGFAASIPSGSLHIFCNGSVTIQVSASATAFRQVLFFGCNASTNVSISGGPLTINCNNKAAVGLDIYTASASLSGSINFTSQVTVNDAKANDAAATYENGGIVITGRFAVISMLSPRVENVSRTNTSGGACYGIAITDFAGECLISKPYIANVLCPNGTAGVDADGIKVFGVNNAASPAVQTLGKATIEGGTFIDCQGRSIKSQCSDTVVNSPYFKRQYYVSIINSHDVDFQSGNGTLTNPTFEYRKNGATSPLGTNHIPVSFQQRVSNLPQAGRMSGGSLKTEVDMRNLVLLVQESTSAYSETIVEDFTIEAFGTLSTTAFTRSILETDMEQINGKTAGTRVVLRGITGPMNCYAFGYTGYTVGSLAAKLDYELTDITNTLAPTTANLLFWNISGNQVGEVKAFLIRDNANFRDLLVNAVFNFNALVPGCRFNILTDAVTATNAPAWGAGNYALVEALGGPNDTAPLTPTNRNVRVTVTDGATNAVENVFFSPNGGTTWSEELFGVTSGTTKTVTGTLSVNGQLQLGGTIPAYVKEYIGGTLPSNTGATYSLVNEGTIPSTTTDYIAYRTGAGTQNAAFTLGSYIHYWATQGTVTGGSRLTPTTQYGFAVDSNLTGATTNIAFYSQIATGANRYNFYSAGTAENYFAGNTSIGVLGQFSSTVFSAVANGGNVYAGGFKATDSVRESIQSWNSANSGDNQFINFGTEGTFTSRGSISYNRGAGLVAYNTTSDYRAKEVFGAVTDSGATIDLLKVYRGKMIGATVERPMLIAHEAQAVAPYAVTGEKDAVDENGAPKYQQMDVSALVPLLIAEVQLLRARVKALESK